MMTESKYKDELCIPKWRDLCSRFNKLVENSPEPSSVLRELVAIKEEATRCNVMPPRQVEGIVGRCDNYIKGVYGKAATA